MDRSLFVLNRLGMGARCIPVMGVLFLAQPAFCLGGKIVCDPTSHGHFGTLIGTARSTMESVRSVSSATQSMQGILGGNIGERLMERLGNFGSRVDDIGDFLELISGDNEPMRVLDYGNYQNTLHGGKDYSSFIYGVARLQDEFYPQNAHTPRALDDLQNRRTEAVQASTIESMALATQQKNHLKKEQETLADLSGQASVNDSIQYQTAIQTRLLEQIARRLDRLVALQAQQLELISAYISKGQPVRITRAQRNTGSGTGKKTAMDW